MAFSALITVIAGTTVLSVASDYARKVERQTLDNFEDCRLHVVAIQCRMEYELVRLGLMPGETILDLEDCLVCRARVAPALGELAASLRAAIGEQHELVAVLCLDIGNPRSQRKASLLEAVTQGAPRGTAMPLKPNVPAGFAVPLMVDVHPTAALSLYRSTGRGSVTGRTLASFYGARTVTQQELWTFLLELGQAFAFLEARDWNEAVAPESLPVDELGRPALIVGASRPVRTRPNQRRRAAGNRRGLFLQSWVDAGLYLSQRLELLHRHPSPEIVLKELLLHESDSFAEIFQNFRISFTKEMMIG